MSKALSDLTVAGPMPGTSMSAAGRGAAKNSARVSCPIRDLFKSNPLIVRGLVSRLNFNFPISRVLKRLRADHWHATYKNNSGTLFINKMGSNDEQQKQASGPGERGTERQRHEVFGDVNLGAVILFLFLLQLIQQIMNRGLCTC